jgi:hypothetical protein
MSIDERFTVQSRLLCPELTPSQVVQTIPISPGAVGCVPKIYNPEIPLCRQLRLCGWCGKELMPKIPQEARKRFCDKSCSAKWRMRQPAVIAVVHSLEVAAIRGRKKSEWFKAGGPMVEKELKRIAALNPMSDPLTRMKVSLTLKNMKHKPSVRGGNGKGPTVAQLFMASLLGPSWILEYAVSLGRRIPNYPTCYKIDLANPVLKIGIEVDGYSHHSRKKEDQKKDVMLASLGWKVLRFWNKDILNWRDTGMLKDTYISMILEQQGIHLLA